MAVWYIDVCMMLAQSEASAKARKHAADDDDDDDEDDDLMLAKFRKTIEEDKTPVRRSRASMPRVNHQCLYSCLSV